MKLFKFFATLNLLLSPIAISAHAQADRGGNGGDPNELAEFTGRNGEHLQSWYGVKQDLIRGLENDQHLSLNLKNISADEFKTKALHSLKTVKVEFNDQKIEINGVQRPCRNFNLNGEARIECNTATYVSSMSNYSSEEQYQLVAHEYLGAAGIEPNTDGLSDYPISSQISKSLQQVTVKKWAVSNDGYIPGIQCEIKQEATPLKKERNVVLQAHEFGARLIVSEGITSTHYAIAKKLMEIRHYGVAHGLQQIYNLQPAKKNGSFVKFSTAGIMANGAFKLTVDESTSIIFEVSAYDRINNEGGVFLIVKNNDNVVGYNTKANCRMMNFVDRNFTTRVTYMENWLSDKESKNFLSRSIRWLKNSSTENDYFSISKYIETNNLEF